MEFKLPSYLFLEVVIDSIERDYLAAKNTYQSENKERSAFFLLYRLTIQKTRAYKNKKQVRQILLGLLIYELEMIKQVEHKGYSPQKKTSFFARITGGGSELYSVIKKRLGITKEAQLANDLRVICVNQFHKFAKAHLSYKPELIAAIDQRLAAITLRQKNRMHMIAEDIPFLETLQKNIQLLPNKYHALCADEKPNLKREAALTFVNFIHKTCLQQYGQPGTNKRNNFNYLQSCKAQVGALIFILLLIEEEYKNWFFSSEKKRLYKLCLETLHMKNFNEIDLDKKIEWLRALNEHLKFINCQPIIALPGFEDFPSKLKQFISEQEIKKHEPGYAENIVNCVVRYSVGLACAQYTAGLVLPLGGGPMGLAIYLGGGTILMSQLGSRGAGYMYAWALDKIGARISKGTIEALKVTQEGWHELRQHDALTADDQEMLDDLIEAWLDLPDHMVSQKEKDDIRQILPDLNPEATKLDLASFVLC